MEKDLSEMYSDDGNKTNLEKNRKRTVKTRAQVQALEKFYDEHKYPTEEMKLQLAESIGLTEKQVSGWFCHRRLKDKRLVNDENYATGRQDRSSGLIQDHGSGHRQDSCGSTKQGNERNFDTREVESGRLIPKGFSAADPTHVMPDAHYAKNYSHADHPSSGSSSSLRNMPDYQTSDPFDAATARHKIPKFPADMKSLKTRPGPSGYLKVKGRVENAAITAVKRQLGKHYQEDGPLLGVEFDPLPPGAFESATQDPVEETYYTQQAVLPASANVTKIDRDPNVGKGYEYSSGLASYKTDGKGFKMRHEHNIPDSYIYEKSRLRTSLSSGGACYPRSYSSVQFREVSDTHISSVSTQDEYGTKAKPAVEVTRIDLISSHPHLQTYSGKVKEERFRKYNNVGRDIPFRQNISNEYSISSMKRKEYHHSGDKLPRGHTNKNGNDDKRTADENRVKIPFNRDLNATKRVREEFFSQQQLKTSSAVAKLRRTDQVMRSIEMPSSFSEDDESAETSSSVD